MGSKTYRSLWRAETVARDAAAKAKTDDEYRKHIGRAERCLRLQLMIQQKVEGK